MSLNPWGKPWQVIRRRDSVFIWNGWDIVFHASTGRGWHGWYLVRGTLARRGMLTPPVGRIDRKRPARSEGGYWTRAEVVRFMERKAARYNAALAKARAAAEAHEAEAVAIFGKPRFVPKSEAAG